MLATRSPRGRHRRRRIAARCARFAALLLAGACGTLPEPVHPPFVDERIHARFTIDETGELPAPTTTRELIVYRLAFVPQPSGERFGDSGRRWFLFPPGSRVEVTGDVRRYRDAEAAATALRRWLARAERSRVEPVE